MSDYKEIKGRSILSLEEYPTTEVDGQVWFNTSLDTFRSVVSAAAWSSAPSMSVAKGSGGGG